MKGLTKKIFAWLIMGVLICSNTLFPLANEAEASDWAEGVSFESIQDTLGSETLNAVSGGNNLGQVSEASKGFIFKMTRPGVTSGQQNMKIGLYNTQENNVWAGGYILHLTTKTAEGELGWCVRRASDEAAFAFDTFTGLTGDEIRI